MRPLAVIGLSTVAGLVMGSVAVLIARRSGSATLGRAPSVDVPYVTNIEKATLKNNCFRKVLTTSPHSQLVLMAIKPKKSIGMEVHPHTDQFIRIEQGQGTALLDNRAYKIADGSAVTIPAGTHHNIINTSQSLPLKLYTIYSPAKHAPDAREC